MIKAYVCRAAEWVTREALQIHGGMGYAEEFPVSRYFVDARVLSIFEGADETLALKVIARRLVSRRRPLSSDRPVPDRAYVGPVDHSSLDRRGRGPKPAGPDLRARGRRDGRPGPDLRGLEGRRPGRPRRRVLRVLGPRAVRGHRPAEDRRSPILPTDDELVPWLADACATWSTELEATPAVHPGVDLVRRRPHRRVRGPTLRPRAGRAPLRRPVVARDLHPHPRRAGRRRDRRGARRPGHRPRPLGPGHAAGSWPCASHRRRGRVGGHPRARTGSTWSAAPTDEPPGRTPTWWSAAPPRTSSSPCTTVPP